MKETKYCCPECFFDLFIKNHIKAQRQKTGKCHYCGKSRQQLIEPAQLRDIFIPLIDIYDYDESGENIITLLHNDWNIFSVMHEKKMKLLLKAILGNSIYINRRFRAKYETDIESIEQWEKFRNELKHENRFFPKLPLEEDKLELIGKYLGIKMGPKQLRLFRARINKKDVMYSIEEMGKPPNELSTNGRANPVGISYVYLATTDDTAISEVRPSKGESVTILEYKIVSDLELLDLRSPKKTISPFAVDDSELEYVYRILDLLKLLGEELSKPIIPSEATLEYLPSQYLCEMIKKSGFDGIIYKSSIGLGDNFVLFSDKKLNRIPDSLKKYRITSVKTESVIELF